MKWAIMFATTAALGCGEGIVPPRGDDGPAEIGDTDQTPCIIVSGSYEDCVLCPLGWATAKICAVNDACSPCSDRDGNGCWIQGDLIRCMDECPARAESPACPD